MLADALLFTTKQLNDFLDRKTSSRQARVKLSGLVTPEGGLSVTEENTMVLSVVNIVEEESLSNRAATRMHPEGLLKMSSPVYLNIYILISALFKENQYTEGLHWLSLAVGFFQQNPLFLSAHTEMPKGIDKLSFELVNLDIDNMSRFWGALGARYQPSVIYKMRMLRIDSKTTEAVLPEFKEPNVQTSH